ncbi:hypothetical protein LVJ94_07950 [Pendulispora rubella]|uniref:Uncharacterized protein n=1 Tax=Pendulispora rubella TaxID=2741070 RepID=A0ABZ2LEJ2_9BACT
MRLPLTLAASMAFCSDAKGIILEPSPLGVPLLEDTKRPHLSLMPDSASAGGALGHPSMT